MSITLDFAIKGKFRLETRKNGEVTKSTGWFDNLITNLGMNQIATASNCFGSIQVGSGTTTPAFTDTALASRIAGSAASAPVDSIDTGKKYFYWTRTATFVAGTATGNISEVGIGTAASGSVLTSRALVLDSGGSPTSITVLADEDLVVVYKFGIKQPEGDFTDTVSGKGVTIRAARIGLLGDLLLGWGTAYARDIFMVPNQNAVFAAFTGGIGSVTGYPSGTSSLGSSAGIAMASYTADSWQRGCTLTFSTVQANFAIKSFAWCFGPALWQMEMDTAIAKTSSQTFKLGVTMTWSRDSGPA